MPEVHAYIWGPRINQRQGAPGILRRMQVSRDIKLSNLMLKLQDSQLPLLKLVGEQSWQWLWQ